MSQHKPDLVCYHSKCPDGFAAAFAAWLKLGASAEYLPVQYNEDHGHIDFADRNVHILDFSFAPETMEHIGRVATSLTLLDHHASAQEKLARFKPLCCGKVHFDMGHSGAVLAWHHYHPDEPVPFLLQCIESRDLWRWNVPGDKAYLAWLDCMPQDFTDWETALYFTSHENQRRIELGEAMSLKFQTLCESIAQAAVEVTVAGVKGLAVNASVEFVSEVGELLALKSGTFGIVWRVLPDKRVKCSMRAVKPYNVKALAEQFGGGGHPQSASFVLPRERLMELVDGVLEAPVQEVAAS